MAAATNGVEEAVEEKQKGRRIDDPELISMFNVLVAVEGLDIHSKSRVLAWAKGRVDDEMDAMHPNERSPLIGD